MLFRSPRTPRTTSPSSPLCQSTSPPPGPPTTLTCSCLSSCSQVNTLDSRTRSLSRHTSGIWAFRNTQWPHVYYERWRGVVMVALMVVSRFSSQWVCITVSTTCPMPGFLSSCTESPACTSQLSWYVLKKKKHNS